MIAGSTGLVRRVTRLADHPMAAGLTFRDLDGLASLATAAIRDHAGNELGFVAAFDEVPREWLDSDLAHLDAVAALVAQEAGQRAVRELVEVARSATEALELSFGSDGVHSLVEHASRSEDPVLRRTAGVARTALDRAVELRSRARGALRAFGSVGLAPTRFDLVALAGEAVAHVCGPEAVTAPGVSSAESTLAVVGDLARARAALRRSVAVALAAASADDVSVHVAPLESGSRAGATVDVRGAELGVGDLARLAAGQFGRSARPDSAEASARVSIAAGETRVVAPGFEATSTPHGTWLTLHWPLESASVPTGANP